MKEKETAAEVAEQAKNEPKITEANNVPTEETNAAETANEENEETFIYVGPTLKTGLKENQIFKGPKAAVEEYLKETIETYPQIKPLLVSTKNLQKTKVAVKTPGTIMNKYYTDVLSTR